MVAQSLNLLLVSFFLPSSPTDPIATSFSEQTDKKMNSTLAPNSQSNRPRSVSPQLDRKQRAVSPMLQASEGMATNQGTTPAPLADPATVIAAFDGGNYLGHVLARDTGDKTKLCNDSVYQLLKTIDESGKKVKRPFSLVVTPKGINMIDENTNQTAAFIALKDVAAVVLSAKSKGSDKAKIVALLARDRTKEKTPGEPTRYVCHVFRLASVEKNWLLYHKLVELATAEKARAQASPQPSPTPSRKVGWA